MKPLATMIATGAVLAGLSTASAADAKAKRASCTTLNPFTMSLTHFDGYRVFTGPDGDSAVEPYRIDARFVPLLTTGKKLGLIELPKPGAHAPGIVVGPANVDLPFHKAPYKEMFILLGGSVTLKTAKFSAAMKSGSVLLFEDTDAKIGHGGHIGPCGYVSLSVAPQ